MQSKATMSGTTIECELLLHGWPIAKGLMGKWPPTSSGKRWLLLGTTRLCGVLRGLLPGTLMPCGGEFGGPCRGPCSPPRPARCGLMFLLALYDLAVPPRTTIPLRSPPATASRSPISRSGNDNWTQRALRCNTLSSIARLQLRYTCLTYHASGLQAVHGNGWYIDNRHGRGRARLPTVLPSNSRALMLLSDAQRITAKALR